MSYKLAFAVIIRSKLESVHTVASMIVANKMNPEKMMSNLS